MFGKVRRRTGTFFMPARYYTMCALCVELMRRKVGCSIKQGNGQENCGVSFVTRRETEGIARKDEGFIEIVTGQLPCHLHRFSSGPASHSYVLNSCKKTFSITQKLVLQKTAIASAPKNPGRIRSWIFDSNGLPLRLTGPSVIGPRHYL